MTPMRLPLLAAVLVLPAIAAAQTPAPVADAIRADAKRAGKNLVAAAEEMPADKYSFKPTPAQMSFGDIQNHLSEGNDELCGTITGMKPPTRAKLDAKATKEIGRA